MFFGFEYGDGASDFLIYGLDKDWLLEHDGIMKLSMTDFLKLVHVEGGYIIQAHPFREADYICGTLHPYRLVDGVEICNTSHRDPKFNERAKIYADWYDLPVTGGSDSHNTTDRYHKGGVISPKRFTSAVDYVKSVFAGDIEIIT